MMKSKFKKGMSLFLATLLSCTSLMTSNIAPVQAATGQKTKVYLIDYPRAGDSNNNGAWGHGDLHFKNDDKSYATRFTNTRVMGSYSGNVAYCIEPGTTQQTGDVLTEKDENYFNNIKPNDVISGDDIRLLIGRVLQYGYQGGLSTEWDSHNEAHANAIAHNYATQILIWEIIVGERDASFNHITPTGYNAVLEVVQKAHPLYDKIMNYYNSMVRSVQNHTKVPSFCTRSLNSAKVNELKWDGKKYVANLTDSNNVLSNYNFSANVDGVKFSTDGNTLTISMDKAPSTEFTITASKKNGKRQGVVVWSDGNFKPGVGIQDVVTYSQEVNDPVSGFVKMKVSYGSCEIVKTSEDGQVDGINFIIEGNGIKQTITTANGGKFKMNNLLPGTYTVTEQSIDKYEPQEVHRVTIVAGQTSTVTFNNKLKRGELKVVKSSEDNLVEGVKFHLYGTSLSGSKVDEYALTDKNSVATFKDVLISGKTPYTIEEVDTAIRYVVPESQTGPIHWKESTTREFKNILKKFSVTVTKSDVETGTAQGNASLAGAVYGIYKGETLIDKYVTDGNGQFTTKEYICDNDWTIREISPSEGYLIDKTIHKVGAKPELYEIEHNLTSNDVTEQVSKGNIAIIKHTDNGETQIETPEVGAEFEVYLKSAGSYANAKETEKDKLICDENGYAASKNMPYGIYTVHQTKGWDGRELMDDFDVFISKDGETYRYIINNRNFESFIKVVKVDAESGKTIPYAGAGFEIYDPNGQKVSMTFTYPTPTTIDTFYTDSNGTLVTPEKLEYGKGYSLVEVQAPYGYVLDSTPVYFDVTQDNSEDENGLTIVKVNKPNMAQKGTISIEKTGEVFSDVHISGSDETGKIYQPIYKVEGLEGATFQIKALEDIYTLDGTLRYHKDEIVDTITTSKDGLVKSKELYLGKYEVKEVKAPNGMILNTQPHIVELTYAGQDIEIVETSTSFYNDRQKASVSLSKILEKDDVFHIGQGDEIKNVSFGLYANEDIIASNKSSIPENGLIEVITLHEDGKASIKTDLPFGSYYIKEIATDEHYLTSDKKYEFTFEYVGQDKEKVEIAINNGQPIENKLIYGSIGGHKIDEYGNDLEGALIGIFNPDEIEFTKEKALMTTISNKEGHFSFDKVPYGHWIIREIKQPTGYILNDTIYDVTISKNEEIVEVEIVNELIYGNITLTKVDADYPDNKLTGATFEVYKDINENGKIDDKDELVDNLKETSLGVYELKDLVYGHYLVKEVEAPEGFLLDENIYSVFIEEDGKTYSVENKAGIGFINNAMKGSLKIIKTSSDGKVEGFTFRVTGPNGYDRTYTTDEKGIIHIDGLRIGQYKITELQDKASAGYILAKDQEVTIELNKTTEVTMHNTLRDTPETGDHSHLGMWALLATLSTFGIIGATIELKKKKDKNNK